MCRGTRSARLKRLLKDALALRSSELELNQAVRVGVVEINPERLVQSLCHSGLACRVGTDAHTILSGGRIGITRASARFASIHEAFPLPSDGLSRRDRDGLRVTRSAGDARTLRVAAGIIRTTSRRVERIVVGIRTRPEGYQGRALPLHVIRDRARIRYAEHDGLGQGRCAGDPALFWNRRDCSRSAVRRTTTRGSARASLFANVEDSSRAGTGPSTSYAHGFSFSARTDQD